MQPKIVGIKLHQQCCLAHELCISICPEVFTVDDYVVALKDNANTHFESHATTIYAAEDQCPTDAIEVETYPPRPPRARFPKLQEHQGKTVLQLLTEARAETESLKRFSLESLVLMESYYETHVQHLSHTGYAGYALKEAITSLHEIREELAFRAR